MSYTHNKLGAALGWKYNHRTGISTSGGILVDWPDPVWPTDAEQAQAVADYETYVASTQKQDDDWQALLDSPAGKAVKALALVGIERGLWTAAELKAKYRSLL